jgi:hypothetical protein
VPFLRGITTDDEDNLEFLKEFKKKPVKKPNLPDQKPQNAVAVKVTDAGASYNPTFDDHQVRKILWFENWLNTYLNTDIGNLAKGSRSRRGKDSLHSKDSREACLPTRIG